MNQDEIIEMAKQAGLLNMDYELGQWEIHEFTTFAKLVAAKERNEILKMCEPSEHSHQFVHTFKKLIAARGEA